MGMSAQAVALTKQDLPTLSVGAVAAKNRLLASKPTVIDNDGASYCWSWQAEPSAEGGQDLLFKGSKASYSVSLQHNLMHADAGFSAEFDSYDNETACIIWSAVFSDFIDCLQKVSADVVHLEQFGFSQEQCLLSGQSRVTIGFNIQLAEQHLICQGALTMPAGVAAELPAPALESEALSRRHTQIRHRLPIIIDEVELSQEEMDILQTGAVIRLNNSSVATDTSYLSVKMGSSLVRLSVQGNQAEVVGLSE